MVRFSIVLMAILLCVGMVGCKGNTKESLNDEGQVLFQQGNFNGAIVHYKNALEKDPNFVEARFNLGLAYMETGKLDQAEREFQKVQLQNPHDGRIGFQLARIANFQNKPSVAVPLLMAYLKDHPDDPAALEQLAFSATISGDLGSAREHLQKVLDIEPDRVSARLALIHNYMTQGERDKAREAIDALLAKDPKNRPAMHALAQLEAQERDPDGMLDVYARISSIYPSDLFARYKEGSLLIDKGEGDKVRASAEAMIKEFPDKAEGHRLLGLWLSREGKFDEAVTALNKSIRIQADLETYYLLGLAYYYSGNLEMAVTQFQTVVDYSPGFAQARVMLGEIFLRQGRGAEAGIVAEKMIETSPEDFRGHVLKGDALILQGKHGDALLQYSKAVEIAPGHYGLLVKLGLLKLSIGNASGEQDLLAALKASPKAGDSRLALNVFYMLRGRFEDAEKVLTEGLGGGKSDAVLYNALAKTALSRNDGEGSEAYLLKAREADPAFLQTYYNLAVFKLSTNKPEEALDQYDQALREKINDVHALMASAAVLDNLGRFDEARSRLEKARSTGDQGAVLTLSGFLQRHGKGDEALAVLEEEMVKQPNNNAYVLAKARLHILRQERDKAMALYGRLEAADPWSGILERTRAWMALGDMDKAEETARRLISLNPMRAQSYIALAGIQEMRLDRVGAEATLVKAAGQEPANQQVQILFGEFYMRGRDTANALKSFENALLIDPTNVQALTGKGMVLQNQGKNDEAAKYYLQAVQARQDYVPALNNLAMLWAGDEKTRQQALSMAMAAFVRANTDPMVIDTLGYTLILNNRSDEAVKLLEQALKMAPNNPSIRYHLALALSETGRADEARAELQKVLASGQFDERPEAENLLKKLQGS
jgi:putative PEP-CTERM system TPR-repeat lipoprotein